ncbi:MAG TPA: phytoene/squalene synthase family protein [Micromonosporaceae bacterium]
MTADELDRAYEICRLLHARHGRTYYRATRLLPAWKRRHVHALYGFARSADEIVDDIHGVPVARRAERLAAWTRAFEEGLAGRPVQDPVHAAVLHTIAVFELDPADFTLFLRSMAMDLTVASYETYADLLDYMEGSAAVIGSMMLPVLGTADRAAAIGPARELGRAFQLTNFIRDVAEDLARGRIYLPQSDLRSFGVTAAGLRAAVVSGSATPEIKSLIRYEVSRARQHYRAAASGIALLNAGSQACMRTAYRLYQAILDEIERADGDVIRRRARVSSPRRAAIVAACLASRRVPVPPSPAH